MTKTHSQARSWRDDQVLLVHPRDSVLVVIDSDLGIPVGHKIARQAIRAGEPVIKYGDVIGQARCDIAAGDWVHEHNLGTNLQDEAGFYQRLANADPAEPTEPAAAAAALSGTFPGYRRADGRIGIRNEIWIIPTVGCVNRTCTLLAQYGRERIAAGAWTGLDGVHAFPHPFGCSQLGDDHERTQRILAGLIRHGNAAAVLVVGLGCENNQAADLLAQLRPYDERRIISLVTQTVSDELAVGRTTLEDLAALAGLDRRQDCPLSSLVVGLKCGASDAFSGLTANPLLGRFSDRLISGGGRVILSEIPEMFGAEHLLLQRAPAGVRAELADLFIRFRRYYTDNGQPVYENPSPGNKAGGITTLEEKSLGCTQKAGTMPVRSVIRYGDPATIAGLSILEGPGNDLVAITALSAAGAHLILFSTGRGNPLGAPVPTLKIASNTPLARDKPHWIDFDAGPALLSETNRRQQDAQLDDLVRRTVSGQTLTRNETHDYREIALFKNGVTL